MKLNCTFESFCGAQRFTLVNRITKCAAPFVTPPIVHNISMQLRIFD